jgi:uncharacterized protein
VPLWRRRRDPQASAAEAVEPAPPFPDFAYHPDPLATGTFVPSTTRCAVCAHRYGFAYTGPVFTAAEAVPGPICPWCIADGSAAQLLRVEFTSAGPDVPPSVPGWVLDEVAERTPGFTGHQQEHWLYHCHDAAAFVGRTEAAGETAYRFRCRHCATGLAYTDSP